MSRERQAIGTKSVVLNTAATLANNAAALSAAYDNTISSTGDGFVRAIITLTVTFTVAPAANTGLSVWFLASDDGAGGTYEDGDATPTTPARFADITIPVRAVTTAQVISRIVEIPPGKFKVLAKNDATGQTMNSGWTLELLPTTSDFA